LIELNAYYPSQRPRRWRLTSSALTGQRRLQPSRYFPEPQGRFRPGSVSGWDWNLTSLLVVPIAALGRGELRQPCSCCLRWRLCRPRKRSNSQRSHRPVRLWN